MPNSFVVYHLPGERIVFGLKEGRDTIEEVFSCYEVDSKNLRKRMSEVFPDYIDKRILSFRKNGYAGSAAEALRLLLIKERHEPRLLADMPATAIAFKNGYEAFEDLTSVLDGRLMCEYRNLCRHRRFMDDADEC